MEVFGEEGLLVKNAAKLIGFEAAFEQLEFLAGRLPSVSGENGDRYFAELAPYRDGAIFIAHYQGNSEWERHGSGDEIVCVLEGETSLIIAEDGECISHVLQAGELLIVPQHRWHRFETLKSVKVLSVTPQPTDHCLALPSE